MYNILLFDQNGKSINVGDIIQLNVLAVRRAPFYSWGPIRDKDVGEVIEINDRHTVTIRFPTHPYWGALPDELVVIKSKTCLCDEYNLIMHHEYFVRLGENKSRYSANKKRIYEDSEWIEKLSDGYDDYDVPF